MAVGHKSVQTRWYVESEFRISLRQAYASLRRLRFAITTATITSSTTTPATTAYARALYILTRSLRGQQN